MSVSVCKSNVPMGAKDYATINKALYCCALICRIGACVVDNARYTPRRAHPVAVPRAIVFVLYLELVVDFLVISRLESRLETDPLKLASTLASS